MAEKIIRWIYRKLWHKDRKYTTLLSAVILVVTLINFPYGKWFSGWDNLHPEFSFSINLRRALHSVWMSNQGLGHIGGHGYAATLLHTIFIWILSLIVPTMYLRAVFTFLMLWMGAIGAMQLSKKVGTQKTHGLVSFTVGLVYALHLATVQTFFMQLEPFIIMYGLLPWTLRSLINFLQQPSTRNFIYFIMWNILISPIGFIPPVFIVYGIVVALLGISFLIHNRGAITINTLIKAGLTILIINLYWLLPVAYYTFTSASDYLESQNNLLSTQDFNLQSKSFGNLKDVVFLRSFVFNTLDSPKDPNQSIFYAMQTWQDYISHSWVVISGYALFALVLIGVIRSIVKPNYSHIFLILLFLFILVALGQQIPFFAQIYTILQKIPIINQAFRASFTKISSVAILTYALLVGEAVNGFRLKKIDFFKLPIIASTFAIIFILMLSLPIFSGNFLYYRLKTTIPQSYFHMFNFFRMQPRNQRILVLPVTWQWGWDVYDWNYTGSGFLWYGIEQPILHRSFDTWSKENESFYTELSTSVHQEDVSGFQKVIDKYQIPWIFIDTHLVYPGYPNETLKLTWLEQQMNSQKYELRFSEDGLFVYKNKAVDESPQPVITTPINLVKTPDYLKQDKIYQQYGNYIISDKGQAWFPFLDLYQNRPLVNISYKNDQIDFVRKINWQGDAVIQTPGLKPDSKVFAKLNGKVIDKQIDLKIQIETPRVFISNHQISSDHIEEVFLPYNENYSYLSVEGNVFNIQTLSSNETEIGTTELLVGSDIPISLFSGNPNKTYNTIIINDFQKQQVQNCWKNGANYSLSKNNIDHGIQIKSSNASGCVTSKIGLISETNSTLATLNFSYKTTAQNVPTICLTEDMTHQKQCFDISSQDLTKSSDYSSTVVIPKKGIYWLDVSFTPMNYELNSEFEMTNIYLTLTDEESHVELANTVWTDSISQKRINVSNFSGELHVVVDSPQQIVPMARLASVNNCDVFKEGSVQLTSTSGMIAMRSTNGAVACTGFALNDTNHNQTNYVLHLAGTSSSRGLKVYVQEPKYKWFDWEWLFSSGPFDQTLVIDNQADTNLNVNFESKSFPYLTTKSEIKELSYYKFPKEWLSNIYLLHASSTEKVTVITNNQSYNQGWLGIYNGKLLEHVKVNGWSNGWIVPNSSITNHQSPITILYWPQYLEWTGMGILGITSMFCGYQIIISSKRK